MARDGNQSVEMAHILSNLIDLGNDEHKMMMMMMMMTIMVIMMMTTHLRFGHCHLFAL